MLDKTLLELVEEKYHLPSFYQANPKENFFEFNLSDFQLPSYSYLLEKTFAIEKELGKLQGWLSQNREWKSYSGFSIAYNPNLGNDAFQTLGDPRLKQNLSRSVERDNFETLANTYHDTYRFSKIHPVVEKHYKALFDCFNVQQTRGRVSYISPCEDLIYKFPYHKDEFPYQNLRINIPLQTCPEYVLEINGEDEFGNKMYLEKHLEVGKFYVWNTRIPHRVYAKSKPSSDLPRIHIVLGLMPWIRIDGENFEKNEFFGIQPFDMLRKGIIFK